MFNTRNRFPECALKYWFLFPVRASGTLENHLGSEYLRAILVECGRTATRLLSSPGCSIDEIINSIKRDDRNVFMITCFDATYQLVRLWSYELRKNYPNAIIACGGPTPTFWDEALLRKIPEIDVCVRGEGEKSLSYVLSHGEDLQAWEKAPSVSYLDNNTLVRNPTAISITSSELDDFPSPILAGVLDPREEFARRGIVSIQTGRGCPYRCSFCAFQKMSGNKIRQFDVARVVREICSIADSLCGQVAGIPMIAIEDDTFNASPAYARKLWAELIQLSLPLHFACNIRANSVTREDIVLLAQSGFTRVDMGLESADPEVLVKANKVDSIAMARRYVSQIENVANWCASEGISCYVSLIFGLPGDTIEKAMKTLEFVKRLNISGYYWNYLKILGGTELFEKLLRVPLSTEQIDAGLLPDVRDRITYSSITSYDPRSIGYLRDDVVYQQRHLKDLQVISTLLSGLWQGPGILVWCQNGASITSSALLSSFPLDTVVVMETTDFGKGNSTDFLVFTVAEFVSFSDQDRLTQKEIVELVKEVRLCINIDTKNIINCRYKEGVKTFIETNNEHTKALNLCSCLNVCPGKQGVRFYVNKSGSISFCQDSPEIGRLGDKFSSLLSSTSALIEMRIDEGTMDKQAYSCLFVKQPYIPEYELRKKVANWSIDQSVRFRNRYKAI